MYNFNNLNITARTDIGDRSTQQDYIKLAFSGDVALIIVCDGMGGMSCGEVASKAAADTLESLFKSIEAESIPDFYYDGMQRIDSVVYEYGLSHGADGNIGTTIASVCVKDNILYWLAVGDSRIYIIRDGQMEKTNKDHNYFSILENMDLSLLTEEEIETEVKKGKALISYIGMNGVEYYSINSGFELRKDDYLLITTDGLYKNVTEDKIFEIISSSENVEDIADGLLETSKLSDNRDNTSFVIVKVEK